LLSYLPIEDYGIIGDTKSVALVGVNGSIDWFCYPRFDSPSVFGSLIDEHKGGFFKICTRNREVTTKQLYWPETNVLLTRLLSPEGVAEVIDYMPVEGFPGSADSAGSGRPGNAGSGDAGAAGGSKLVRRVTVVRGSVRFMLQCYPSFDYGRSTHRTEVQAEGAVFQSDDLTLGLASPVALESEDGTKANAEVPGPGVRAEFTLGEKETATFVLQETEPGAGCGSGLSEEESEALFERTVEYWRNWVSQCTYRGRWREMVVRSALVLKLLTYSPTGAIVAAPTSSLPEGVGGERNWDYRYTWIRDAAFTLYGLLRIGFADEAGAFMRWIEERAGELNPDGSLQIMYGIDGRHTLTEQTLDHLEGYRGSQPVRIGNGAYNQLQLDIYGELMDAVYLYNKHGTPISYDLWIQLRRLVNWVCDNWQRTDEGVWEVRGGQQHFVYSKLMCWVAVDRAIRLAQKRSFPADHDRWLATRDAIYEEIMEEGWNEELQSFVQAYGSDTLDASNLIMPLVFFLSPTDRRMLSTLDQTLKSPDEGGLVSNSLVYRYNVEQSPDGLKGEEGTFNICSFWLVEALTRAGRSDRRRLDEARLMFEKMLGYANHLGLYAEETGPTGEHLGNFPQAFTHLALISAAYNLDRSLG
jgi:GH15 family glucan-1,4-alpha-glucosidase